MNAKTLVIFAVLIIATVSGQNGGRLNNPCRNEHGCKSGFECRDSKCKCPVGHKLTGYIDDNAKCDLVFATTCGGNDECEDLVGAICESKKCICPTGITADSRECIPIIENINDRCTYHSQCIHAFSEYAICKNDRCTCKEQYYLRDNNCVRSNGINQECQKNEECYANVNNKNSLACKENICSCTVGFRPVGDSCESSASVTAASMTVMVFAAIGILRLW